MWKGGFLVDINTSVWLLKEKAKELIDSKIDVISVSVKSHLEM